MTAFALQEDCCHNILLYFDDGVQWPKVYQNDSMVCCMWYIST